MESAWIADSDRKHDFALRQIKGNDLVERNKQIYFVWIVAMKKKNNLFLYIYFRPIGGRT